MSTHDQQLFEAQKKEFDTHTALFHEKVTRMYLTRTEEGVTFDDRIHAVWDEWDVPRRQQFITKAYRQ